GVEIIEIDTPEFGEGITDVFEGLDETENPGTEVIGSDDNSGSQGATGKADSIIKETPFSVTYTETSEDGTEFTVKRTDYSAIIAVLWLCGMVSMLLYTAISYLRIYRRVRESAPLSKNVRVCDNIDSPFILGIVRPKIYLPSDIDAADRVFVLAHERAHLKRFDHIWKPLGFLLLSIYWFHPLLWVAYILLCKDIEYACDEKVIKELGAEQKKTYSTALINCSVSRKMLSACPLAFGETGVKGRVKSVLHYKKPAFWIIIASVVVSAVLAVCFLTNPKEKKDLPKAGDIITFGTYEQDNVTENGAEPIEWIVVDVFDGKATLLSKYGLDAKPYHEDGSKGIYWADCSLRSWLNSEFYETAFDEKERDQIITTRLDNHSNASYNVKDGAVTEDKVYLLSIDELYQIFKTEAGLNESQYRNKASITTSTAYAKAQGVWEGKNEEGAPASPWLLRTLGVNYASVCRVNTYGELSHEVSNDYGGCALRPAMRINLEDAEYVITELAEAPAEDEEKTVYTGSGRFKDLVSLEKAKPGYVVEFGTYEQNQDVTDGTEPIEWYVLDVKDGRALLLSKYILENMPYHKYEEEISWKNCTLREWLNGTFYEAAFNDEEKKRIATTLLENVWNPWNTFATYEYTEDKVFLPSMEDMLSGDYFYTEKAPESAAYTFDGYLMSDTERMARGVYEEDQWLDYGGYYLYNFDGMPYGAYWLRASSRTEYRPSDEKKEAPYLVVAGISIDGSLDTTVNNTIGNTRYDENGVRPAIWVELGDLDKIAKKNEKKNKENNKKSSVFLSSKLPERYEYKEVKESFLEYLNHQAYLYPAEYTQEKWECDFEVYSTADSKMKRVYLKAEVNGEERWYLCTPTVYLEEEAPLTILPMDAESVESLRSTGAIKHLGTDTVKVAAAKAPEYHKNIELDATGYKESIALISDELCKNGYLLKDETYTDVIKLEVWISEFDMEKMLYPHAYIIINDSYVYETSFTKYKGLYATFYNDNYAKDHSLENHFGEQVYMPDEFDGRSIKPLASVDQAQLEHVKNCAALHYVYEPDFSVTITVDGKEVTLPKKNVCITWEDYTSIAFVPQGTVGGITRYHIYRSTDGGNMWSLVSKKFQTNAEEIAAIKVPEDDYVVCYFNRVGGTYHSSCYFSEDGGVTWSMPEQANKPKVDLADAAVGTSVVFGSYEQDFDLSNGKEPVEWIVLDRVGDKALLVSRFGLEYYWDYQHDIWEESGVRRELNEYFYVDAFSSEERERIVKTAIKTPNDTGIDIVTEDYVFLLSESEVSEGKAQDGTPYFKDSSARLTMPVPMYGIGAWMYSDCENDEWDGIQTKWLLRSKGTTMYKTWVTKEGAVRTDGTGHEYETVAVLLRPAIWVDLSGLEGDLNRVPEDTTSVLQPSDFLREQIESTNISIAIGDKYAAYLDEKGK
ncbi:MAG: M56 family metallopeptidase, partial [Lachnospiraceae bacterium]|nr:M56 family metallopeptidase [Lachnospiraceae bacterium]